MSAIGPRLAEVAGISESAEEVFQWRKYVEMVAEPDPEPDPPETPAAPTYAELVATYPDVRVYWRLAETSGTVAADSSGNGRAGTYVGAVELGRPSLLLDDPADRSAKFPGGNGKYVTIPSASWLDVPNRLTFTVAFRLGKWAEMILGARTSWANASGASSRGWHLIIRPDGRFNVGVRFTDSTFHDAAVGTPVSVGDIHVATLRWDGTTVSLWVDGSLMWSSNAYAGKTLGNPAHPLRLSAEALAIGGLTGELDEAVLAGAAWSDAQVTALHATVVQGVARVAVDYGAAGWKRLAVAQLDAVDRSAVAFDDSAWTTHAAPFGNSVGTAYPLTGWPAPVTDWPVQSAIWLRRHVAATPGQTLRIGARIDNLLKVYWNGALVLSAGAENVDYTDVFPVTIDGADVLADNVLAVRAQDDVRVVTGDRDYADVRVELIGSPPPPEPEPDPPGEFGWIYDDDRSPALHSWAIVTGRADAMSRTQPTQVTVTLARDVMATIPELGERFRLAIADDVADALGIDADARVRFTGEVTDVVLDHDSRLHNVIGVGRVARAARQPITPIGWPAELDGPRVSRVLAATGVALDVGDVDPGTAPLAAPPSGESVVAGLLLDTVTDSTGGQLVEQRTGAVDWQDRDARRGAVVLLTLTASMILSAFSWAKRIGSVLNIADVGYASGSVRETDPNSVEDLGPYSTTVATALVDRDDASSLGATIVGRRSRASWQLPALVVDLLRSVPLPLLPGLLALRHSDRIAVAGLPEGGAYTDAEVYVEGVSEAATSRAWRMSLAVSDPRQSGVALRWEDLPADLTWEDLPADLTWLDLTTIEDPADLEA